MAKQRLKIQRLDNEVSVVLQSQVLISSLCDALREVIQNSVDSGADRIEVNVNLDELGFTVYDSGCGIDPNDLRLVGSPHYTSKLTNLDELKSIATFGFRGQALHAISSVSNLSIISKTSEYGASYWTTLSNSKRLFEPKILDESSVHYHRQPRTHGTIIHLRNLFANVPVRRSQAEKVAMYKVLEEIRSIALQTTVGFPHVNLIISKRSAFDDVLICNIPPSRDSSKSNRILSLMNVIYGISMREHHQYLEVDFQNYKVSCIIGKIPVQTKGYQFIFWNNRVLKNTEVRKEINKMFTSCGFGTQNEILIPSMSKSDTSPKKGQSPTKAASSVGSPYSKFPVFVIIIEGKLSISDLIQDPSKNIESSKTLDFITQLILKIMKSFLKMNNYRVGGVALPDLDKKEKETIQLKVNKPDEFTPNEMEFILNSRMRCSNLTKKEVSGMLGTRKNIQNDENEIPRINIPTIKRQKREAQIQHNCKHDTHPDYHDGFRLEPAKDMNITKNTLDECTVIKQLDSKFILVRSNSPLPRLLIIDQHALDERIKVEQFLKKFIESVIDPFHDLAVPVLEKKVKFHLNKLDIELLKEYTAQCELWGLKYVIEDNNNVRFTHLPEILIPKIDEGMEFLKNCLRQYLADLKENRKLKSLSNDWWSNVQAMPTIIIDLINSKACRLAIMFGKKLEISECEQMLKELAKCRLPFQCAHGRPSIVPICDLGNMER